MSFHCEGLLSDAECKEACDKNWVRRVIEMQYCKAVDIAENSIALLVKYSSEEAANALRGKTYMVVTLYIVSIPCYQRNHVFFGLKTPVWTCMFS